jgi:hypothetical protein
MADPRHPANDAWEALLSAHASLMRRFSAEDVWEDVSMKEYDVLYTLSKCPDPIRPTDLNQHVLLSHPGWSTGWPPAGWCSGSPTAVICAPSGSR